MENKKEPLMSAEEFYMNSNIKNCPSNTLDMMDLYANYFTQWHLNNAKEFVADEAELEGDEGSNFTGICIDKQSIHTAIDNYIEFNL